MISLELPPKFEVLNTYINQILLKLLHFNSRKFSNIEYYILAGNPMKASVSVQVISNKFDFRQRFVSQTMTSLLMQNSLCSRLSLLYEISKRQLWGTTIYFSESRGLTSKEKNCICYSSPMVLKCDHYINRWG